MYPYRKGKCERERERERVSDTMNRACFMSQRDINDFLAKIGEVSEREVEEG